MDYTANLLPLYWICEMCLWDSCTDETVLISGPFAWVPVMYGSWRCSSVQCRISIIQALSVYIYHTQLGFPDLLSVFNPSLHPLAPYCVVKSFPYFLGMYKKESQRGKRLCVEGFNHSSWFPVHQSMWRIQNRAVGAFSSPAVRPFQFNFLHGNMASLSNWRCF